MTENDKINSIKLNFYKPKNNNKKLSFVYKWSAILIIISLGALSLPYYKQEVISQPIQKIAQDSELSLMNDYSTNILPSAFLDSRIKEDFVKMIPYHLFHKDNTLNNFENYSYYFTPHATKQMQWMFNFYEYFKHLNLIKDDSNIAQYIKVDNIKETSTAVINGKTYYNYSVDVKVTSDKEYDFNLNITVTTKGDSENLMVTGIRPR